MFANSKIQLIRMTRRPIVFRDDWKAQYPHVEIFGPLVVGANNRYVMNRRDGLHKMPRIRHDHARESAAEQSLCRRPIEGPLWLVCHQNHPLAAVEHPVCLQGGSELRLIDGETRLGKAA